jgi:hypothetical protein
MLAQAFKSAIELGLSDPQRDALVKTLVLLETNKLEHVPAEAVRWDCARASEMNRHFNMCISYGVAECGTVGCIRGTAERVGTVEFPVFSGPEGLYQLFYDAGAINRDASVEQASTALRSYLATGDARWDLALA